MHPNPRRIFPIILILAIGAAFAWWYFYGRQAPAPTGVLTASGTIEAAQVVIAPELGGQVLEVLAEEGEVVQASQPLVRFKASLLQAQLEQAQASLALAQANYDLTAAGMPPEQRRTAVAAAELEVLNAKQSLDDLHDNASLAKAHALQAIAVSDKGLDQASDYLTNLQSESDQADIDSARSVVVLAKDKLDKAREDFKPYEKKAEDNLVRAVLQSKLAEAQKQYDLAVTRLNNLMGTANEFDLSVAEANQLVAQEQLASARRQYEDLKDGPDPALVAQAEARLELAEARLASAQANAEPTAEQLAVAQAQVEAARSALAVIQAQMDKLVLLAPSVGVVLSRSVEPGEVVLPGAALMTLADLSELTITVYVPEDRYGLITLGQTAQLTADSFPGEKFIATVIDIASQAEFTPRNVQTAEGRSTTVYAVKLAVEDPLADLRSGGRLKPGMPADVNF